MKKLCSCLFFLTLFIYIAPVTVRADPPSKAEYIATWVWVEGHWENTWVPAGYALEWFEGHFEVSWDEENGCWVECWVDGFFDYCWVEGHWESIYIEGHWELVEPPPGRED